MLNRNRSDEKSDEGGAAGREGAALREAQEDRGLELLHRARGLRGLTAQQIQRIASGLDAPVASVAPTPRRRLVPVLVAFALLLFAGSVLAWATGTWERLPLVRTLRMSHAGTRPTAELSHATRLVPSSEVVATIEPAPAAPLEPEPTQNSDGLPTPSPTTPPALGSPRASSAMGRTDADLRPRVRREKISTARSPTPADSARPPTPPTPSTADSPIAREGESFANVLRRWHQGHDARGALGALDIHDRSFADGQMTLESRLLRVELLLADNREREALVILDGLPLGRGNVPRGRELLTVRGELRIKGGRCADGLADLASLRGGSDALAERARNALTHCEAVGNPR